MPGGECLSVLSLRSGMFGWHWSAPILLNELWPTEFVSMSFVQSFGRVAFSFGDIDAVAIKLLSAGLLHRVGTCRAPPFLGRSFITPENTCVVCWAFIGSRLSLATVPYRNYANLAVPCTQFSASEFALATQITNQIDSILSPRCHSTLSNLLPLIYFSCPLFGLPLLAKWSMTRQDSPHWGAHSCASRNVSLWSRVESLDMVTNGTNLFIAYCDVSLSLSQT